MTRTLIGGRPRISKLYWIAVPLALAMMMGCGTESTADPPSPGEVVVNALPGVRESHSLFAGIPQEGISLGEPSAPVTIVEFSDLQCPFCKRFAVRTLPTVIER